MDYKINKEQLLELANTNKLIINENEIDIYLENINGYLNDFENIFKLKPESTEILITPNKQEMILREDEPLEMLTNEDALVNTPKTRGNFIEVPGVIDYE